MTNFHNDHRERERRTGWTRRLDDILSALAPTEDDTGDALRFGGGATMPFNAARSTRDARHSTVNANPRKERRA